MATVKPATDEEIAEMEITLNGFSPSDERQAWAERIIHSLIARIRAEREALEEVKADRLSQIEYACDLQRIIEDMCHGRDIREPKTSAVYYYNMAVAFRAALNGEVKK